jgi:hydroxypyruvate isomerase
MDDLCRQAAELGLSGLDLVDEKDWPTCRKYGLVPVIVSGAGSIPVAWNRQENHDKLEKDMRDNIAKAAAAKAPNVITFSGNRRGLADDQGRETCILGLKRVAKIAEDAGITICLELLNSKVDHKDYQCDHTKWGVDVIRRAERRVISRLS